MNIIFINHTMIIVSLSALKYYTRTTLLHVYQYNNITVIIIVVHTCCHRNVTAFMSPSQQLLWAERGKYGQRKLVVLVDSSCALNLSSPLAAMKEILAKVHSSICLSCTEIKSTTYFHARNLPYTCTVMCM